MNNCTQNQDKEFSVDEKIGRPLQGGKWEVVAVSWGTHPVETNPDHAGSCWAPMRKLEADKAVAWSHLERNRKCHLRKVAKQE